MGAEVHLIPSRTAIELAIEAAPTPSKSTACTPTHCPRLRCSAPSLEMKRPSDTNAESQSIRNTKYSMVRYGHCFLTLKQFYLKKKDVNWVCRVSVFSSTKIKWPLFLSDMYYINSFPYFLLRFLHIPALPLRWFVICFIHVFFIFPSWNVFDVLCFKKNHHNKINICTTKGAFLNIPISLHSLTAKSVFLKIVVLPTWLLFPSFKWYH